MPLSLPSALQEDLIKPNTGGAWMWLCEIAIPTKAIQYLAKNTEDVVYGETYTKANLEIGPQSFSSDGSIPRVTLRVFQDTLRTLEQLVEDVEGVVGTTVSIIKVGSQFLGTPIAALKADYSALSVESDSEWITFTLGIPNPLTQRIPLRSYSSSGCPFTTPSLFKGPECQYALGDASCTGTLVDCKAKGNAAHWGANIGLDPNGMRVA